MSFRCGRCKEARPSPEHPETRPIRVITAARPRRYGGWEIAKEENLCMVCVRTYEPPTVVLTAPEVGYYPDFYNEPGPRQSENRMN